MGDRAFARPWLALLLIAGLVTGAHATASTAAATGTSGPCPTLSGVTVVVDFGSLGGVAVRCAPGSPSNGFAALAEAGFSVEQAANYPGAVCRISGLPPAGQEPCIDMPPADAYWSYWHASRGGSWGYAPGGASSSHPGQGTVEGWAFGSGASPSARPPDPPQPTPKPTANPTPRPATASAPAGTATPTPAPAKTARPSGAASASPSPPAPTTDSSPAGTPPSPSAVAAVTVPSGPADGSGASSAPGDGATPTADDPGAPPIGTLAGIGLVAALLGGGFVLARRRGAPDA